MLTPPHINIKQKCDKMLLHTEKTYYTHAQKMFTHSKRKHLKLKKNIFILYYRKVFVIF